MKKKKKKPVNSQSTVNFRHLKCSFVNLIIYLLMEKKSKLDLSNGSDSENGFSPFTGYSKMLN